jgi:hypothetical protein
VHSSVEVKEKMNKPKPIGRAITEDSYLKELEEYQEGLKGSLSSSSSSYYYYLEDKENECQKKRNLHLRKKPILRNHSNLEALK